MDLEPEQTCGCSSFDVSTVFGQQAATSSTNCGESDLNRRPHTGDGLWKRSTTKWVPTENAAPPLSLLQVSPSPQSERPVAVQQTAKLQPQTPQSRPS